MDRCYWLRKVFSICLSVFISIQVNAQPLSSDYTARPPLLNQSSEPLVMLVMSVDHELFKKAYSDYSDLDNDGRLDTTYNNAFNYLGYFDSNWCYQYSVSSGMFQPEAPAEGESAHYCTSDAAPWSGNFLNWATMSRIDVLRKVLFGGKRSVDSTTQTVLERAYLPRDVHSFVKIYDQPDLSDLTPHTGSISLCSVAETENGTPLVRIAEGDWSRWASTEVRQCQWREDYSGSTSDSPRRRDRLQELVVKVETCVFGKDENTSNHCRKYFNNKSKPAGLLQQYGESGSVKFGLLSGSYDKNLSGGVLRRNISKIAGNQSGNDDEINLETGQFNASVNGIIQQINTFRIANYSYSQNRYSDCSTYNISTSQVKSTSRASNRRCSNWGNPLAEMYLEALRYFAGESQPSNQYKTDKDYQFVPGLAYENWSNPQNSSNACANCSIIVLSTGLNSFDTDQYGAANDIPGINGSSGVDSVTDLVGVMESTVNPDVSFPGKYLADKTGGGSVCEETDISRLSDIRGICPEQPQLEGGYQISGLAWLGRTSDLRTDLNGLQSVKTYVVQLAENLPEFSVDVDGKIVTFQPVCQAHSSKSECSLTDVVVENLTKNGKEGEFLFTWEDSLWGNDYDYDASSRIKYCVGDACSPALSASEIKISIRQEAKNAGADIQYSYSVTGTDKDGIQEFVLDFERGDSGCLDQWCNAQGATNYEATDFEARGDSATLLPKPIWFAAKYGGFVDQDGDNTPGFDADNNGQPDPGDSREWDIRNNDTGALGKDGLPDNYFFSKNPTLLAFQLDQVFSDITSRVSSSTNTSLISNSNGTGVIYQALYQPKAEANGKTVQWGGLLHSLFVDSKGYLREDGNGNDQLDDYGTDKIIELSFDPNAGQAMVQRYISDDNGVTKKASGSLASLASLETIWDARKELSQVSNVLNQRTYQALASGGRHLLTWLDADNDQQVDAGETKPFIPASFSGLEGYLGVNASEVTSLVNYIRGEEQSDARNRSIDFDGDGLTDTWRLGDIVHSTPRMVAAPDSGFDASYQDSSYKAFLEQYQHRRHVIYVGANDGFIHAFNGGFWNEANHSYERSGDNSEVQHPLGAELWAYTPMNLLPHLQWLREMDYPHVYYMDGEPLVFDANIFTADADHPGGWGTVLVMGMRLGGGAIDVSVNGSNRTMRSAYVVLDITNPEKAPELLAEITHPDLGFTSSRPELIKFRKAGSNGDGSDNWLSPERNDWYLVFGSGPGGAGSNAVRDALNDGKSSQNLRVFIYDLKQKSMVSGFDPLVTSYSQSYAGDMTVKDWDQNYQDDNVYFGSVDTGGSTLGGQLLRLQLSSSISNSSLGVLLNAGQPIVAKPLAVADKRSYWVYSGTGRLLTEDDNRDISANYFYGVQEPVNSSQEFTYASVNASSLIDTSDVEVLTDGTVRILDSSGYTGFTVGTSIISDFTALQQAIKNQPGWKRALSYDGVNPSGRNINGAAQLFSLILFSEYQPPADSCSVDGNSYLYALNYLTGTAEPSAPIGTIPIEGLETPLALDKVSLGLGFASAPVTHQGEGGKVTAVTQGAGGSITGTRLNYQFSSEGRQSWWQIFKIPWVEQE